MTPNTNLVNGNKQSLDNLIPTSYNHTNMASVTHPEIRSANLLHENSPELKTLEALASILDAHRLRPIFCRVDIWGTTRHALLWAPLLINHPTSTEHNPKSVILQKGISVAPGNDIFYTTTSTDSRWRRPSPEPWTNDVLPEVQELTPEERRSLYEFPHLSRVVQYGLAMRLATRVNLKSCLFIPNNYIALT